MADPTTLRTFYGEGSRRRSGRSHTKMSKGGSMLGGDAYQQGIEIKGIHQSRGLLPVFSGEGRYKTITQYRIESGNKKRVVYASEDPRSNNYFLDSDKLVKSKYTFDTTSTQVWMQYPDTEINQSEALATELSAHYALYAAGEASLIVKTGNVFNSGTVIEYFRFKEPLKSQFPNLYVRSNKPRGIITFPDGGITQVMDYAINIKTYGDGKEYLDNTPFVELEKYDAIKYVRESGPLGMFPEVSKSKSYNIDMIYNGIIEPFDIRQRLYGKDIFEGDVGSGLVGEVNERIDNMFPVSELLRPSGGWFEDIGGSRVAGFKQLDAADYVTETNFHLDSYLDRNSYDNIFVDEELENVLISMDATLDEGSLPFTYVDMSVGYTAPAKDRWAGVVYRDMLR